MPSMRLTSLRRIRTLVVGQQTDILTLNLNNNRLLEMWIDSVSGMIEKFLDRTLKSQAYTEYFPLTNGRTRFWVKGTPITTLTSVYEDSSGEWEGSESELTDSFTDENGNSANIPFTLNYAGVKNIRVIYTGGLATHPVNSTYTIDSGTFTTGKFVIGSTSGAVGVVVSQSGTALTIEDYYGTFDNELITEYDNEDATSPTGETATISAVTASSLLRVAPEIVMAAENQIRFMWEHTTDFENNGTNRDGATLRRGNIGVMPLPLQRETLELLTGHRRIVF